MRVCVCSRNKVFQMFHFELIWRSLNENLRVCNINWKNKVPGGQNYPHRISDRGNEKSMTDGRMEGCSSGGGDQEQ